jgi:UDP-3-O-[3-hydroxymyristoyl] glucosamine N-acyltransferase
MADKTFFKNNGPFNLAEVALTCGGELEDKSKSDLSIIDVSALNLAGDGEICAFHDRKVKADAAGCKASACIVTKELAEFLPDTVAKILSTNPKQAFVDIIEKFYKEELPNGRIAESAKIASSAKIEDGCIIGENVVICENVKVGANTVIESNAVVDKGCVIGANCKIGNNASIAYAVIGNNTYIYCGARIGQDGFGFVSGPSGHRRIPQLGRVIIGNDVEVGANSSIDRGALKDTIIGDGTKIDNLVQIGHNVELGKGCVIVSQTGIAGSCKFGNFVVTGGQSGFADHLTVEDGAQIAAQSGIIKNVKAGEVLMGTPAFPIKQYMRQIAYLQKIVKSGNKNK